MQVEVLNTKGKKTGRTIELPEEIFGIEPNEHVVYLAVKQYLAAQRQGTHKVKTRAEVQGSSRKLHRQKGTGGSRKGNIRNPLYKGGGTIFGPKPHLYNLKVNRKVKDLAKMSALSVKAKGNGIVVVEDISMETPKTKSFMDILTKLKVNDKKIMYVSAEYDDNVDKSLRNIPSVLGVLLSDINTYDLMNSDVLVLSESAAKIFSEDDNGTESKETVTTETTTEKPVKKAKTKTK
jgi:large subunit ribosomal protein L4